MTQRVDQLQYNLDILVRKGRTAALWNERPQQAEVFLLWHPQRVDATVWPGGGTSGNQCQSTRSSRTRSDSWMESRFVVTCIVIISSDRDMKSRKLRVVNFNVGTFILRDVT